MTEPPTAATRPNGMPKTAPAARLSSGRGTRAAVATPYAAANSRTAAPTGRPGGQPSDRMRWGSYSTTHTPAASSSTTSSDSRVHGARRRDIPGD